MNFCVAFTFFFLIFFVNSILLLVQKILLKNITFGTMIEMVLLSMPQFLIYTFPFATLSAASMVLGDLNSANELLALRSSGVPMKRVFRPILVWGLIFSCVTFWISDYLLPTSNIIYKDKLTRLMMDTPTFELEPYGTNSIGDIVLSNGFVEGSRIEDIVLVDRSSGTGEKTIASVEGEIKLVDVSKFLYELDMKDANLLLNQNGRNVTADAESARFYLDFSDQVPSLTSTNPVNLSSKELLKNIRDRVPAEKADQLSWHETRERRMLEVSHILKEGIGTSSQVEDNTMRVEGYGKKPMDFYGQYYKAELTKKFTLSLACFVLCLVALPLGLIKLKYGKLTGFAISLLIAVLYWYMVFFVQMKIFDIAMSPYLLILAPDIVITVLGLFLFFLMRRAR